MTTRKREADENPNFESTIRGAPYTHVCCRVNPAPADRAARRSLQGQAGEGEEAGEGLPERCERCRPARPGERSGNRHQGLRGDGALVVGLPRPHERRTPRLVGCLMFNTRVRHRRDTRFNHTIYCVRRWSRAAMGVHLHAVGATSTPAARSRTSRSRPRTVLSRTGPPWPP